jgi:hypothetical protein
MADQYNKKAAIEQSVPSVTELWALVSLSRTGFLKSCVVPLLFGFTFVLTLAGIFPYFLFPTKIYFALENWLDLQQNSCPFKFHYTALILKDSTILL